MKITGVLVSVTIAVVLSMNIMNVEAAPMTMCDFLINEKFDCKMVDGIPVLSCQPGHSPVRNIAQTLCLPTEWNCRVEVPKEPIKCDSPLWNVYPTGDGGILYTITIPKGDHH